MKKATSGQFQELFQSPAGSAIKEHWGMLPADSIAMFQSPAGSAIKERYKKIYALDYPNVSVARRLCHKGTL